MWSSYFPQMLFYMVMAALMRMAYELARPAAAHGELQPATSPAVTEEELQPMTAPVTTDDSGLTPQQREWSDRAVQRYAESQERKWRRWNEAMFK